MVDVFFYYRTCGSSAVTDTFHKHVRIYRTMSGGKRKRIKRKFNILFSAGSTKIGPWWQRESKQPGKKRQKQSGKAIILACCRLPLVNCHNKRSLIYFPFRFGRHFSSAFPLRLAAEYNEWGNLRTATPRP